MNMWKKDPNGGWNLMEENRLLGGYKFSDAYRAYKAYFMDETNRAVIGDFIFKDETKARDWVEKHAKSPVEWTTESHEIKEKKMYLGEGTKVVEGQDPEKWGEKAQEARAITVSRWGMCKVKIEKLSCVVDGIKATDFTETILKIL